jgi:hypothetical protein
MGKHPPGKVVTGQPAIGGNHEDIQYDEQE